MTTATSSINPLLAGALLLVNESSEAWNACFRDLAIEPPAQQFPLRVCAFGNATTEGALRTAGVELASQLSLSDAVTAMFNDHPRLGAILLITSPVSVPEKMLEHSLSWMNDDPRLATVSFLSNAAGALSFPHRNTASPDGVVGWDESAVTARLRELGPDMGPVPILMPAGPAILISKSVLSVVGGFNPAWDLRPSEAIAEIAFRMSRRGFQHRLDAGTFVRARWFSGFPAIEAAEDTDARQRLSAVDSSFPMVYDQQKQVETSPAAIAMNVARSKVAGLRILVDGSCLGPMEMGTQVQTVELIRALSRRRDVSLIAVAVPHGTMPAYASDLVLDQKIRVYDAHDLQFTGADLYDVLHRPFQPDRAIPWDRWRSIAKRLIVTLQDLIAYRIGAYHAGGVEWQQYRSNISEACGKADAVIAISEDTRRSIVEERLNIAPEQIFTVKNGGNHLDESALEETPPVLIENGMIASTFIFVLGATYAHKNRDIAIRVWRRLRERGYQIALVMAGANVPRGSSRLDEESALRDGDDLLVTMPDVSSSVRTWLLRHAAVVLYPTSAEGFGLVPFEAAAMGTPTAHVNFGPLQELINDPLAPGCWSVEQLADYTHELLTDPVVAAENIKRILKSGAPLTWDETARGLVDAYRNSLARAPRA